jgi:hypothetical protein
VQTLAALVALRILIPLAVLAASPKRIPLLPGYTYVPLNGDAYGSYHAVANLYAAFSGVMLGWIGLGSLVLIACFSVAAAILWRAGVRWLAVLLPFLAIALPLGYLTREMADSEAGVIGWSLAWAAGLAPLPLARISLDPDRAFAAGLVVSVAANAVTVVATAVIGLRATGRRSVGLIAAGLFATWPIWVGVVAGHGAWANGQWAADAGLHMYSEPISTASVTAAIAVAMTPRLTATNAAVIGLLLGYATLVKLPNGLIAAAVVLLVAWHHGMRRAAVLALGGLVSLPILIGFWPHGYVDAGSGKGVDLGQLYRWSYVGDNIRTSPIFTGPMLLVLIPLALVGIAGVLGWYARWLLIVPILATFLSFGGYYVTGHHPRFYYVILPLVFVLQAAGVMKLADIASRPRARAVTD